MFCLKAAMTPFLLNLLVAAHVYPLAFACQQLLCPELA